MKRIFTKIIVTPLILLFVLGNLLLNPLPALAQSGGSDPAITNASVIPSNPAPGQEVDFIISYGNGKSGLAEGVELVIDYNENRLTNVSIGNTEYCRNADVTIRCYFDTIPGNSAGTIGFTATVNPTAKNGMEVITTMSISQQNPDGDIVQNNFKTAEFIVSGSSAAFAGQTGLDASLGLTEEFELGEPSTSQGLALFDVQDNPNWEFSALVTGGLKFMIRGKEALAWTLNINDSGFHNPAIRSSYLKVLTVVNSLFIIGLLAIAAMWMFSLLIPRKYLRQVVLVYGLAVIFVNFALPINQLLIDGTGLLQKTFMSGVQISSIVETPSYNDGNAVGYQNETNVLKRSAQKEIGLKFSAGETPEGEPIPANITIGQLEQDFLTPSYTGAILGGEADQTIQLRSTGNDIKVQVPLSQSIQLLDEKSFNPDQENIIFSALMVLLTGVAYFAMALIFLLRIVILWALMIVSPILFLLAIFRFTRSYFYNWMGIYARWLLIGPLMALGISIVVNIWQAVGLPIDSAYPGLGEFGVLSNVGFYLPGSQVVNTLSTTPQMMEYVLFLVMLYLPIFFAFMLTRQRMWSGATAVISDKAQKIRSNLTPAVGDILEKTGTKEKGSEPKKLTESFKGLLGSSTSRLNQASALPSSMKNLERTKVNPTETAHSFLPEHLAVSKIRDLVDLTAGDAKGSRNAHKKSIETMASPDSISDKTRQQQVVAVRQEISERASRGDADAARMMTEIHEVETQIREGGGTTSSTSTVREQTMNIAQPVEVQVSVKTDADKKKSETTQLKTQKEETKLKPDDSEEGGEKDKKSKKHKDRKSRQKSNKKKDE
ncbi:type IV secretion system protein [Candidatus Pacearchaeota archaeon]|nr:type IV secretion system protein [Candidatus Pacearchaeota archaeon]